MEGGHITGGPSGCRSGGLSVQANVFSIEQFEDGFDLPLQMPLFSVRSQHKGKHNEPGQRVLTAVSSIVLSPGSTFPPGRAVSPAYVRKVDARLFRRTYRSP